MNILDDLEKNAKVQGYLTVLKMGAMHLGADFKISDVFSGDKLPTQLPAFYKKKGMAEEATEAITWWVSLPPELQIKYDS